MKVTVVQEKRNMNATYCKVCWTIANYSAVSISMFVHFQRRIRRTSGHVWTSAFVQEGKALLTKSWVGSSNVGNFALKWRYVIDGEIHKNALSIFV
jgi:hypothetical protein